MLNVICSFKPDFSIILGDFNARPKPWWQNDIDTNEGTKIDAITSYHGLHQYSPKTLKYCVGVQQDQSYLRGEGASLTLVGDPSSDTVTIKMPYWVDVLYRPASHPIVSYWIG